MKIDWILPIGSSENELHVLQCLESLKKIMSIDYDRLIVVCEMNQWKNYNFKFNKTILINPPIVKNAAAYRNKALENIISDFCVFQDADDISLQNRRLLIEKYSDEYDLIASDYISIDFHGKKNGYRKLRGGDTIFFFRNNIPLPSLAVRSSSIKNIKFNEDLIVGEDNVLIAKLIANNNKVKRIEQPTIEYRVLQVKNEKRTGIKGAIGEWKYKRQMMKNTNGLRYLLTFTGMIIVISIKLLPKSWFKKLYSLSHSV